jgi:hypothetical protein
MQTKSSKRFGDPERQKKKKKKKEIHVRTKVFSLFKSTLKPVMYK